MTPTTLTVGEACESDDDQAQTEKVEVLQRPSVKPENSQLMVNVVYDGEEDALVFEEAELEKDPNSSEKILNRFEAEVDILTEIETGASLSSDSGPKPKVLRSSWWNVLWGLISLFACFVLITTFAFVSSEEPWAGVSILLLTFTLIGFYTVSSSFHRRRYMYSNPKKKTKLSTWKNKIKNNLKQSQTFNWALIAAFFIFALLAVTSIFKKQLYCDTV